PFAEGKGVGETQGSCHFVYAPLAHRPGDHYSLTLVLEDKDRDLGVVNEFPLEPRPDVVFQLDGAPARRGELADEWKRDGAAEGDAQLELRQLLDLEH